MFWRVWKNLAVSYNTPICTNFFTDCSTNIINCVIYVIFTCAVHDSLSIVPAALFRVLVHHIEETVAIALLFYIIVMN